MLRRILVAVVLLTTLSACTPSLSQNDLQKISKVGVYAAYGNSFHNDHIGFTAFTNSQQDRILPDWKMADYTEQAIITAAQAQQLPQQYGIVELPSRPTPEPVGFFEGEGANVKNAVLKAASEQGYDTVIIARDEIPYNIGVIRPHLRDGYGMYDNVSVTRYTIFYVGFSFRLYDVKSGNQLAYYSGEDKFYALPKDQFSKYGFTWKENVAEYEPKELETLETLSKQAITRYVDTGLEQLHLGTKMQN